MTKPKKGAEPAVTAVEPTPTEQAEIERSATIEVEWNDRTWTVPAGYFLAPAMTFRDLTRYGEMYAAGMERIAITELAVVVDIIEGLLGRAQFAAWTKGSRTQFADASDLLNTILAAWGATPGE